MTLQTGWENWLCMGKLDCFVWKGMCFLSKKKILQANLQLVSLTGNKGIAKSYSDCTISLPHSPVTILLCRKLMNQVTGKTLMKITYPLLYW